MSGHKRETVTISQEEYRRMYEAERRAMYDTFTAPQHLSEERVFQRENEFACIFRGAEQRNQEYEQVIQNLQSELREVERQTQNKFQEKQARLLEEVAQRSARSESDAHRWLEKRTQQIEEEFTNNHRSIEAKIENNHLLLEQQYRDAIEKNFRQIRESNAEYLTGFDKRISAVEQRLARDDQRLNQVAESARQWLNDGIALHDFLVNSFPPRSIESQELVELEQSLNQAQKDFAVGMFESCLSTCRFTTSRLSILRVRAENTEIAVNQLIQQTLNSLDKIRQKADMCRNIQAIDIQGQPLDMALDVAQWAPQELQAIMDEIEAIEEQVRQQADNLIPEQLHSVLGNDIPRLQTRILELADHVQHLSLNAQIRYNIAQMVVAAVITQGYRITSGSFDHEDFDQGYVLNAMSGDGGELVVRIDPIPGQVNAQDLQIISKDHLLRTESELRQRAREINKSLKQFNLEITNKQVVTRPAHTVVARKSSLKQSAESLR
ncbi:MAG: hypothetical protein JW987_11490 [Anaerolineaceae bacterium]|nr:hypothetical protein [Anaerolineaceae bacterium]